MCSNCYYSALHWLPNLVCVIMLFIAEVMRHERPYRISEVIELCVKYKEIVSNELCDRQVYLVGRYEKRSQKLEMK